MKFLVSFVIFAALVELGCSMTEKQIKAAQKLIRNQCQPKSKVTDQQIEDMHKGVWEANIKQPQCYMNCVLNAFKVAKPDGNLDFDAVEKILPTLPDNLQETMRASSEACKSVETSDDKCETSWRVSKCYYESNPEKYLFP